MLCDRKSEWGNKKIAWESSKDGAFTWQIPGKDY